MTRKKKVVMYLVAFVGGALVFFGTWLVVGMFLNRMLEGLLPDYAVAGLDMLLGAIAGTSSFLATVKRMSKEPGGS